MGSDKLLAMTQLNISGGRVANDMIAWKRNRRRIDWSGEKVVAAEVRMYRNDVGVIGEESMEPGESRRCRRSYVWEKCWRNRRSNRLELGKKVVAAKDRMGRLGTMLAWTQSNARNDTQ